MASLISGRTAKSWGMRPNSLRITREKRSFTDPTFKNDMSTRQISDQVPQAPTLKTIVHQDRNAEAVLSKRGRPCKIVPDSGTTTLPNQPTSTDIVVFQIIRGMAIRNSSVDGDPTSDNWDLTDRATSSKEEESLPRDESCTSQRFSSPRRIPSTRLIEAILQRKRGRRRKQWFNAYERMDENALKRPSRKRIYKGYGTV